MGQSLYLPLCTMRGKTLLANQRAFKAAFQFLAVAQSPNKANAFYLPVAHKVTDLFDKSRSHPSAENGASVLEQVIALQFAFVLSVCNSYPVTKLMQTDCQKLQIFNLKQN